jgi:predicted TIM-barrel fold metal-dependent hydrolase
MNDYPVIDCDGHVEEMNVDLTAWIDEPYRALAPRKLTDNRGNPRILLEGKIQPAPAEGPNPGTSGPRTDKATKHRAGMSDPQERLKDMDAEGIDVAILFGTSVALTVNGLMDKELAAALCRGVNAWLLDYCAADRQRLRPVALLPCQDPPVAARMLEDAARQGCVAAMLPNNVYGINLGERRFDPIYAAAQEVGLPLCVHPQAGHDGVLGVNGVMGAGAERFFTYAYVHMTSFPFELMIALMHMIGEGVFDRFPRLKVAYMEGGAGWLTYWLERMDEHYEKLAPQWPLLQRKPSEIIRGDQIVVSCESEEETLPDILRRAGEHLVMYASDYSHWDCRFPESVRDIAANPELTAEQKRNVLSANAIRFFGLTDLPQPQAGPRLLAQLA